MVDTVQIGDRVRWVSAGGTFRGEVSNIRLARNAAGALVPWLYIEHIKDNQPTVTMMSGNESSLNMLRFRVNFRDQEHG